jgi:uncharacterized protein (DUF2252 family)
MTDTLALPGPRQPISGSARDDGHPSPEERAASGKAARLRVSRRDQGEYEAPRDRFDPVDLLEKQSAERLPELVPVRYGRMSESPFRFYRGAAALMAADLARRPHSGLFAQLCGDAHMLNFRLLASPERHLLFDINDFDETLPGPFEWDVKRLAASLAIAGRANGFSAGKRRLIITATVRSYREWMHHFAGLGHLEVWYTQAEIGRIEQLAAKHLSRAGQKRLARSVAAARRRDNLQAFEKLTESVGRSRRIRRDPPLLVPISDLLPDVERGELEQTLASLLERYGRCLTSDRRHLLEQFRVVDMARKVVGVGSVGTRCWIVLLLGRDDNDPLLLQVKEAGASVLAEHVGSSDYANQGQRVVAGQRLMQAASDVFLGWERVEGIDGQTRDFYVRQLRDWKAVPVAEEMTSNGMRWFGVLCGATLARAHARSGDRIAIAGYLGRSDAFDRAVHRYAERYADQTERDHQALLEAVRAGRVPAVTIEE